MSQPVNLRTLGAPGYGVRCDDRGGEVSIVFQCLTDADQDKLVAHIQRQIEAGHIHLLTKLPSHRAAASPEAQTVEE